MINQLRRRGKSVSDKAAVWTTGFRIPTAAGILVFATVSRLALGPTQPPIQKVLGNPSTRVKQMGREADDSTPFTADVNNAWSYTSTST
jgi:hypothetical protein